MMSLLPFWALTVVVLLLLRQGQKALRFHQKYIHLCSKGEWRSYVFGIMWGWAINDRIFILGLTILLSCYKVQQTWLYHSIMYWFWCMSKSFSSVSYNQQILPDIQKSTHTHTNTRTHAHTHTLSVILSNIPLSLCLSLTYHMGISIWWVQCSPWMITCHLH